MLFAMNFEGKSSFRDNESDFSHTVSALLGIYSLNTMKCVKFFYRKNSLFCWIVPGYNSGILLSSRLNWSR